MISSIKTKNVRGYYNFLVNTELGASNPDLNHHIKVVYHYYMVSPNILINTAHTCGIAVKVALKIG